MDKKSKIRIEHWHVIAVLLAVYDTIAVNMSYFAALWLRYDCAVSKIASEYLSAYFRFAPVYTVICIFVFFFLRLYKSLWRFASYRELIRVITASVITGVIHTVVITMCYHRMPISYYFIGFLLQRLIRAVFLHFIIA